MESVGDKEGGLPLELSSLTVLPNEFDLGLGDI